MLDESKILCHCVRNNNQQLHKYINHKDLKLIKLNDSNFKSQISFVRYEINKLK